MRKILGIAFILLLSSNSYAYDNEIVHPSINENAVFNAKKTMSSFIALGFKGRTQKELVELNIINKKKIKDWLREGGRLEDEPDSRTMNHFHDPLKPWSKAGLKGSWLDRSSLVWAQDQRPEEAKGWSNWSWPKARAFYYAGLTQRDKDVRDENLALTFRSMGQVMHLLSDATVPAHVRNDVHIIAALFSPKYVGWTYESWAKENYNTYPNLFNGKSVDPVIFNSYVNDVSAPIPISVLWDKNVYKSDGSNPEATWTTNPTISECGLAEYTNANFFSEDTIFNDYPHPAKDKTTATLIEQYARDGKLDETWYLQGYQTERLAALSYFHFWDTGLSSKWAYHLDEKVYEDYVSNLIPRAVGYSAALLDYFFRGDIRLEYDYTGKIPGYVIVNKTDEDTDGGFQIFYDNKKDQRVEFMSGTFGIKANCRSSIFDITPPVDAKEPGKYILVFKGRMGNEEGAVAGYVTSRVLEVSPPEQYFYSMVEAGDETPYFNGIKVKLRNPTNETMKDGTLRAIAKYKSDTYDTEYIYSLSETETGISFDGTAKEISFDFTNDPIPVDATDLYLEILFKGTIGDEQEAVAVGIKDINEPTPIDIFNDTDESCINGSWYSTSDAIDLMDTSSPKDHIADLWDVNPHVYETIYVNISSSENPQEASPLVYNAAVSNLYPGEFRRVMYILTDDTFKYSFYSMGYVAPGYTDNWLHAAKINTWDGEAVKNQTDYSSDPGVCGDDPWCYEYIYPVYDSIRGNDMWWGGGMVFTNPPYPSGSSCNRYGRVN